MQVKKYFEKKVSLLSTSDVRYDGELYTVDPSEQSIALKHVNCMGTEGRRTGDQAIAPSDCTYEFIIFRAVNIRELWLDEGGHRVDLTDEILIPLRQGQTNNNYQKRGDYNAYEAEAPKRKVGYQSHSSSQQQGTYHDQYYGGGHHDQYYGRGGGGGYNYGPPQQAPPPPPRNPIYHESYQQRQPPPQTYYDTPSQNNYYSRHGQHGQQAYQQRAQPRAQPRSQPRHTYQQPPPSQPYYTDQRQRQRPPQYYNQQQRAPQYYNQGYQPRPQYGHYSSQPRRYDTQQRGYGQQRSGYNKPQSRGYNQRGQRQIRNTSGKTQENQAGTGAFLDTRRLRGTEIDIKDQQDFDFGAAKNEFDSQNKQGVVTQQNGVEIVEQDAVNAVNAVIAVQAQPPVEQDNKDKPVEEDDNNAAIIDDKGGDDDDNKEASGDVVVDGNVGDDNNENDNEETKTEDAVKKYDKNKSFFDGLETETKKSKPKQDLQQQKDTDTKTFGSVAATYKSRHMTNRQQGGRYNQNRNRNYNRYQQGGGYQQGGYNQYQQNRGYNQYQQQHQQPRSYNQYNQYNRQQYTRPAQQNTYSTTTKWVRR